MSAMCTDGRVSLNLNKSDEQISDALIYQSNEWAKSWRTGVQHFK